MPDRTTDAAASEPESPTTEPDAPAEAPGEPTPEVSSKPVTPGTEPDGEAPGSASAGDKMPEYKGEPLDAERGPGLGCFWIQIGLLTFFLIFTPLTVTWGWDPLISGALLIFTLILLLFSGQTIIFLLRLVAADRRTRRAPLNPSAKPTVGQMEDAGTADVQTEAEASAPDGHDQPEPGGTQSKGDER